MSYLRVEGLSKITGSAVYVDDLPFSGLYGATVRSLVARGLLKAIRFDDSIPWDEFTVIRASDLKHPNNIAHIIKDQPLLADQAVNHVGEAVVLLAHPDKHLLRRAVAAVTLDIEPLEPILSIKDSLAQKQIIWGEDNSFKTLEIKKGTPGNSPNDNGVWVEGSYETGAQEQMYIEPQGLIAHFDENGVLVVQGSMQCPYYVLHALTELFECSEDKVRVVQTETGGGFGGKEDYPSVLACHAAVLAESSGQPVKMVYERHEDLQATTKRHPSKTHIRTLVSKEGKLLESHIDFYLDGGAYCTLSPVVLSRGALHAMGPYACDHVIIKANALATNTPPNGAFRGFGAPQSVFAIELHMDAVAKKLNLEPLAVRKTNLLTPENTTATGQKLKEEIPLEELIKQACQHSEYESKRLGFDIQNQKPGRFKKGIGISTFLHGAGFTGNGERDLKSVVSLTLQPNGTVDIKAASTEMGQGKNTVFAQIVAEALNIDIKRIQVVQPDTHQVPNSGPTVASRTTMVVGKLLERAAIKLKPHLSKPIDQPVTVHEQYKQPEEIVFDDKLYQGDAYPAFAYGVYVAEVEVDTVTMAPRVTHFYAYQDVGTVVNKTLAEGQVEGGVLQGIGYALFEKVVNKDGAMLNNQMTNYIIPTSMDMPDIHVGFVECPTKYGAKGAKGLGELPLDGSAPAVISAVNHALGSAHAHIPLMPEDFL